MNFKALFCNLKSCIFKIIFYYQGAQFKYQETALRNFFYLAATFLSSMFFGHTEVLRQEVRPERLGWGLSWGPEQGWDQHCLQTPLYGRPSSQQIANGYVWNQPVFGTSSKENNINSIRSYQGLGLIIIHFHCGFNPPPFKFFCMHFG